MQFSDQDGSGAGMGPATAGVGRHWAVVGLQWGDEGKGKLVDRLAGRFDAVVRYNGGANAGHSVVVGGVRYALHLVPSGILAPGVLAVVGNGVVVDPERLIEEMDGLSARGVDVSALVLSDRAHVVLPYHKAEDALREELLTAAPVDEKSPPKHAVSAIGTTRRGIGPAYADKVQRATAVRVGDLLRPELLRSKLDLICSMKNAIFRGLRPGEPDPFNAGEIADRMIGFGERLRPVIKDTTYLLHDLDRAGKTLLFEGANATMLDVDHGTFPYVTSSNASSLGIGPGSGLPPQKVGTIIGVVKAYSTRVGGGPMPTELFDETAHRIRERGREYGTTTGRPRRVGWIDLVALKYAAMVSGVTEIGLTLLDVLAGFDELKLCVAYETPDGRTDRFLPDGFDLAEVRPVYESMAGFGDEITGVRSFEDLPGAARRYVEAIEAFVGVPVRTIGVGPDRVQTIEREAGVPAGGRA
ncbi:MAG: adenylosuccinate synthase [Phycisphaerales bacterium]|nr:adenylosuccinate synthase [Phycisphaerales bacterium]